jgi:hypothetical protein
VAFWSAGWRPARPLSRWNINEADSDANVLRFRLNRADDLCQLGKKVFTILKHRVANWALQNTGFDLGQRLIHDRAATLARQQHSVQIADRNTQVDRQGITFLGAQIRDALSSGRCEIGRLVVANKGIISVWATRGGPGIRRKDIITVAVSSARQILRFRN